MQPIQIWCCKDLKKDCLVSLITLQCFESKHKIFSLSNSSSMVLMKKCWYARFLHYELNFCGLYGQATMSIPYVRDYNHPRPLDSRSTSLAQLHVQLSLPIYRTHLIGDRFWSMGCWPNLLISPEMNNKRYTECISEAIKKFHELLKLNILMI